MSFSEKIYRVLLQAYPQKYRRQYSEPMDQLFRDRLRTVHGVRGAVAFWFSILTDWAASVPARQWERFPHLHYARLPDPAMRCLFFARFEAGSFSRNEITVEDLLLGILRQERSLFRPAAPAMVVASIEAAERGGRRMPPGEDLPLSMAAKRALATAKTIAEKDGRKISPADLAAGILCEKGSLAAKLVREHMSIHNSAGKIS